MNTQRKKTKILNVMVWAMQSIMALTFLAGGLYTLSQPVDILAQKMSYASHFPAWAVKLISISEILGAIGLIAPSILRIKPALTPLAAAALTLIMILATAYHITYNEIYQAPMTIVIGSVTAFIAWARSWKYPISERFIHGDNPM